MKKLLFRFFIILFLTILACKGSAQINGYDQINIVVNNMCMINIGTVGSTSMTLSTSVAGSTISPVSNSNAYLRVTSVVPSGTTRKVSAIISYGAVPAGTLLRLSAAACSNANYSGSMGSVTSSPITLNNASNQTVIDGIGSCYTGSSSTDGYQISYTWLPDQSNYRSIHATTDAISLSITFTIAASN